MTNKETALLLASRDWHVFPCKPDKSPYTAHGWKEASLDQKQIDHWWTQHPDALIGIACAPSRIFAVDIDDLDSWRSLESTHETIADTWMEGPKQKTPRGGLHLVFNLPEDITIPNNSGILAPGIDLRSNGYICTGNGYEWLGNEGYSTPVRDAPSWLLTEITNSNTRNRDAKTFNIHDSPKDMAKYFTDKYAISASFGTRNDNGYSLALQLRDLGLSETEAEYYIREYVRKVPNNEGNPYTETEAIESLRSAYTGISRQPAQFNIRYTGSINQQRKWSAGKLLKAQFSPPIWVVPNIIPVGLSIIGGRPKVGKSWLALQISAAVGSGGKFFTQEVHAGKVLYLALEDTERRMKERISKMQIPENCELTFDFVWEPLQDNGIWRLSSEIETNKYSLVVIDTISRAIPGIDQSAAEKIGPIYSDLQNLSTSHEMSVILVDHIRKSRISDPIDDIIASTAKTGTADTIFGLYKSQNKNVAVLRGRGRDIEEIEMNLKWDNEKFLWQEASALDTFEITDRRQEILSALKELGKAQASSIARKVNQDPANTRKRLDELVQHDLVHCEVIDGLNFYMSNN